MPTLRCLGPLAASLLVLCTMATPGPAVRALSEGSGRAAVDADRARAGDELGLEHPGVESVSRRSTGGERVSARAWLELSSVVALLSRAGNSSRGADRSSARAEHRDRREAILRSRAQLGVEPDSIRI